MHEKGEIFTKALADGKEDTLSPRSSTGKYYQLCLCKSYREVKAKLIKSRIRVNDNSVTVSIRN